MRSGPVRSDEKWTCEKWSCDEFVMSSGAVMSEV